MARSYAPLICAVWSDPDWIELSAEAQRLYLLAVSQPNVSYAGVVPYTARRWARMAADTTPAAIEMAVDELVANRFLVIDEDTEEILVRSFVRHNGVLNQPQIRKAMHRAYAEILSATIRDAFLDELPHDERTLLAGCPHPARTLPASEAVENTTTVQTSRSEPLAQPARTLPAPCPPTAGQEPVPRPKPEHSSSSSTPTAASGEEEECGLARGACLVLALRSLKLRSQNARPIVDRQRWLLAVAERRQADHAARTAEFLASRPNLNAEDLADLLEPELARRKAPPPVDHSCPHCEGTTWVLADDGALPCPRCRT